ncbi:hypothetical protein CP533_0184 [Ophiocordyceps camponoti-saundersi (nom. inval.)]|nr:hypothetical protein CP533_0184 [Ophiocordyceps camponoti-saundersi (nom. inval.)]
MLFLGRLLLFSSLPLLIAADQAEESCEASSTSSLDLVQVLETLGAPKECKAKDKECRNSTSVAPQLEASFKQFNIGCRQEAACLVGLAMLESVNFTFMRNQSPGRPGQGTVNMQQCGFNLKWAKDLKKGSFSDVTSLECADKTCKDADKCNDVLNAVLETDQGNFFSLAWFYATQCDKTDIKTKLRDNVSSCADYVTECVGTNGTDPERVKRNGQAFEAFGVSDATECIPL